MISEAGFRAVVARALLAPSVHNAQPTRWRRVGNRISLFVDLSRCLEAGDPTLKDAALSAGAAAEATVLALSEMGLGAAARDCWAEESIEQTGFRRAMVLDLRGGAEADPLSGLLDTRFTWRGLFAGGTPQLFGWSRDDLVVITDHPGKAWVAEANDRASLRVLRDSRFRRELVSWMRLRRRHPRWAFDGMNRDALNMAPWQARLAGPALGPAFGLLDRLGLAAGLAAEEPATRSAQVVALFHRDAAESPVVSGRAYLRLWLEATKLGFAGWPMAALGDDAATAAAVADRFALPHGRRLVQAIRFGFPGGPMPLKARRPLEEVLC